jgi:O-antigen biosynthesis rhamnosyltransferase
MSLAGGAIGPKSRPLRVLHVYKTYYPDSLGGVEQVILQLATALQPLGAESRVLTLSANPHPAQLDRPEGRVVRCPTTLEIASNPVSWSALRHFRDHCAWADVVHYQFPWPFADLMHVLRGPDRPSVVSYQSDIVRQKQWMTAYRPLMDRFLDRVDRVVTTSPRYLDTSPVLSRLGRAVDIIPNGLSPSLDYLPSPNETSAWRQRVGEGFFLFVGVLRYYKGLDTLLDAAVGLPARVVIAGDGPERLRLEAKAVALGLTNVVFLGRVSDRDKACLLLLSAAFVFPSNARSEAFGMSLVEAAMHGKPMVSCEIGTGTSFINLHGETGLTVPPDNPAALADAMQRLASNSAEALRMGLAARIRYETRFTADVMASRYFALYKELVGA